MTSEVITLTKHSSVRQTTLRIDADLLRRARFYLDEDGKSVSEYLVEQLRLYVQERERQESQSQSPTSVAS